MKKLLLFAIKDFSDRFRNGWVIACALVWIGAISLTSLFGLVQIGSIGIQGYERTVVSLLNVVQYLVPLLGLLLGHDLLVAEREDRTLCLLVASGVPRATVIAAKFLGGILTLSVPLVLGFVVAGVIVGLGARDTSVAPYITLAASGLGIGVIFLAVGLLVSTFSRTRVQALVLALLAWCAAVFVYDLVAMGTVMVRSTAQAAQEVESATDATHVNAVADMHAAFESGDDAAARSRAQVPKSLPGWVLINPVDLFRVINLPGQELPNVPVFLAGACLLLWISGCLGASAWKLRRVDL